MAALLMVRCRRRHAILPPLRDRRNPLDHMADDELIGRYRMDRNSIFELCRILDRDLYHPTRRHGALPVSLQICIALRYYATGSFQSVLADGHGVSTMAVSRCIHSISYHLTRRMNRFIQYPVDVGLQRQIKQGFYGIANFPKVLGAANGTFIPIKAPSDDEHLYVTRKGFHAINVQGICDSDNIFLNLVARWPGSTHDSFILMNSQVSNIFETGQVQNGWLLGDSAYPLKHWLLTPLQNPHNAAELRYNRAHKRTRCVVERTFGMWKMRFRCLHKTGGCLTFSPSKNVNIIIATGILHNECVRKRLPLPNDDTNEDDADSDDEGSFTDDEENNVGDEDDHGDDQSGQQTRAELINSAFR